MPLPTNPLTPAVTAGADAVRAAVQALKDIGEAALAVAAPALDVLRAGLAAVADVAAKALTPVLIDIKDSLLDLARVVAPAFAPVRAALASLAGVLGGVLAPAGRALGAVFSSYLQPVLEKTAAAVGSVGRAALAYVAANAAAVRAFGELAAFAARWSREGANLLRQPFQSLHSVVGAVESQVAGLVRLASPGHFMLFQRAVDDLFASVGRALVPVLQVATQVFRSLGSVIFGLNPHGQKLIAALAAGTVGLIGFAAAVAVVQAVVTGGIAPVLAALAGAMAGFFAVFQGGAVKSVIDSVTAVLGGLAEQLGVALEALAPAMGPVLAVVGQVGEVLAGMASFWAGVAASMAPALQAVTEGFRLVFEALRPAVEGFAAANMTVIADGLKGIASAVAAAVPFVVAFAEVIGEVANTVMGWVRQMLGLIGVTIPALSAPTSTAKDNTGAAVRNVSTGGVDDVLRRARESAFSLGTAANKPEARTANAAEELAKQTAEIRAVITGLPGRLEQWFADLPKNIGKAIREGASRAADGVTEKAGGLVNDVQEGIERRAKKLYDRLPDNPLW